MCPSLFSIAVINVMTKSNLGRKAEGLGFFWGGEELGGICPHYSQKSSKPRTWRQELVQRPWKGAAYWLTPRGLLSLLSYRTQDHQPRDGTTHNGLDLPPLITN